MITWGDGNGVGWGGDVTYQKSGAGSVAHAGLGMSAEDAVAAVLGIRSDIWEGGCAAKKSEGASDNGESLHLIAILMTLQTCAFGLYMTRANVMVQACWVWRPQYDMAAMHPHSIAKAHRPALTPC